MHRVDIVDWSAYQQDLEDAFRLECSEEDLQTNEDAKELFKYLNKQRKYTKKLNKIANKIMNGGDSYAEVFRMF